MNHPAPLDNQPISDRVELPDCVKDDQIVFEQEEGIPKHLVGPIDWQHPCRAQTYVIDHMKGKVGNLDQRKRKKVCIVGYAVNSRHLAWYDDPDCEIWGVNQLYRFIPRADRWFQIHKDWNDRNKWANGTDQEKWLREAPIPSYMIEPMPGIPNSVAYPIDWVKERLGLAGDTDLPGSGLDYFTSTIAFMYALAIAEGFEHIGIYGIDLIIGREYFFEKSCVEFYMGIAHGRGIHIHRPENSALLWQSHRYGYEPEPNYGFYSLKRLSERAAQLRKQVTQLRDDVHRADGAILEAQWVVQRLAGNPTAEQEYQKRIEELRKDLDGRLNKLYLHDGALQEIERLHAILDLKSRGGSIA